MNPLTGGAPASWRLRASHLQFSSMVLKMAIPRTLRRSPRAVREEAVRAVEGLVGRERGGGVGGGGPRGIRNVGEGGEAGGGKCCGGGRPAELPGGLSYPKVPMGAAGGPPPGFPCLGGGACPSLLIWG